MGIKKVFTSLLFLIFASIIFVSCNFIGTTKFSNEKEAQIYVRETMKEKYGTDFVITEYRYEAEAYDNVHKVITGSVDSVDGQYKDICFNAQNRNGLSDDFAKIYFKEPLIKMTDDFMKDKKIENLEAYEINVYFHNTRKEWTGKENLDYFIEKENPTVEIVAHLGEGYNAEEYAQQIVDCMKVLTELSVNKEFRPYLLDSKQIYVMTFGTEWQTPNNNRLELLIPECRGAIYSVLRDDIPDVLASKEYLNNYSFGFSGNEDHYLGVGETYQSYMERNNLDLSTYVVFENNYSPEEYAEYTLDIIKSLSEIKFNKTLTIKIFIKHNTWLDLYAFNYTDPYTEKTEAEITEEYRKIISEYEQKNNR